MRAEIRVTLPGSVHLKYTMNEMDPTQINPRLLLAQSDWLRSLALSLVQDGGNAQELAQDTLTQAWITPPRGAGEERALRAWLAQVARNLARSSFRDRLRRKRREQQVSRPEAQEPNEDPVELAENSRILLEEVMALSEPSRSAVLLHYFEGQDSRVIAEQTGTSPAAVRKRLWRAREALRVALDQRHGGKREAWLPGLLLGAKTPPKEATFLTHNLTIGGLALTQKISMIAGIIAIFLGIAWFAKERAGQVQPKLEVLDPKSQALASLSSSDAETACQPSRSVVLERQAIQLLTLDEAAADRPGVQVQGRIRSKSGVSLANATLRVRLHDSEGEISYVEADIDPDGQYAAWLAFTDPRSPFQPQTYKLSLSARAKGYRESSWKIPLSHRLGSDGFPVERSFHKDLVLALRGPCASGSVVDAQGKPERSFWVSLIDQDGEPLTSTEQGYNGSYDFDLPEGGLVRVAAYSRKSGVGLSDFHAIVPGENASLPTVQLKPTSSLRGQVVNPNGKPLPGIQIHASRVFGPLGQGADAEMFSPANQENPSRAIDMHQNGCHSSYTRSDEEGLFEFHDLAPGDYELREVSSQGNLLCEEAVSSSGQVRIVLEAYAINLRVEDNGGYPVPNAKIVIQDATTLHSTHSSSNLTGKKFFQPLGPKIITVLRVPAPAVERAIEIVHGIYEYEVLITLDFLSQVVPVQIEALDATGKSIPISGIKYKALVGAEARPTQLQAHQSLRAYQSYTPRSDGEWKLSPGRYAFEARFGEQPGNSLPTYFSYRGQFEVRAGCPALISIHPQQGAHVRIAGILDEQEPGRIFVQAEFIPLNPSAGSSDSQLHGFVAYSPSTKPSRRFRDGGGGNYNGNKWVLPLMEPGQYLLRLHGDAIHTIERNLQLNQGQTLDLVFDIVQK